MNTIGVNELKTRFNHYFGQIKKGRKLIITQREKAVAAILPISPAIGEYLNENPVILFLLNEGLITWKGGKPDGCKHPFKIKGRTLSDIVIEDRR